MAPGTCAHQDLEGQQEGRAGAGERKLIFQQLEQADYSVSERQHEIAPLSTATNVSVMP